jgi:hypothetical protein
MVKSTKYDLNTVLITDCECVSTNGKVLVIAKYDKGPKDTPFMVKIPEQIGTKKDYIGRYKKGPATITIGSFLLDIVNAKFPPYKKLFTQYDKREIIKGFEAKAFKKFLIARAKGRTNRTFDLVDDGKDFIAEFEGKNKRGKTTTTTMRIGESTTYKEYEATFNYDFLKRMPKKMKSLEVCHPGLNKEYENGRTPLFINYNEDLQVLILPIYDWMKKY